ncbi:MamK family actin-like protein [Candidatus Magnetaquicoccus inordinatus]|uniref:MamK family actin-like protein n=1 Tax=Candidatus Magnetaquicoccus inordinatus TaxID=2496818 RepID=UPI00102CCAC4|nr:MamK family actin-like protein [Candidatus Magnetaquicoccus inordinatus]MBF0155378.1 rod shape-determining protein [Magnetococcales bacterium]
MKTAERSPLLLGIDLGTSRTMVLSNRGARAMVRSVVGYPKDIIGVKLMHQAHIIGEEALKRQSYLNIHYPLEDGVLKEANDQAAESAKLLIQHVINLADPQPGDRIYGVLGVPARASMFNKNQLLKITQELLDLSMVVSEPFMAAYEIDQLNNAIMIDIGAGTTDICAMKGSIPSGDEQVTVLKAGNYIDLVLENLIRDNYPDVQMTNNLARKIKEQYGFVGTPKEEVIVNVRIAGKPGTCNLTREVRTACETVVSEIVEHLQSLIKVFDPEDQEEALRNIYLTGGGAHIRSLDAMICQQMHQYGEVIVRSVPDPDFCGGAGALKLAMELPPQYWEQVGQVSRPVKQS